MIITYPRPLPVTLTLDPYLDPYPRPLLLTLTLDQRPLPLTRDPRFSNADPKMFSTGMSNGPVKYFKNFLSVLNPNQTALFQKPKRNFFPSDEIWFENSPI